MEKTNMKIRIKKPKKRHVSEETRNKYEALMTGVPLKEESSNDRMKKYKGLQVVTNTENLEDIELTEQV